MADSKEQRPEGRTVSPFVSRVNRESYRKGRLPVMPLAVLLPSIGELSGLTNLAQGFERRLSRLQGELESTTMVETEQDVTNRACEESMLNQIMQWLNADTQEE